MSMSKEAFQFLMRSINYLKENEQKCYLLERNQRGHYVNVRCANEAVHVAEYMVTTGKNELFGMILTLYAMEGGIDKFRLEII